MIVLQSEQVQSTPVKRASRSHRQLLRYSIGVLQEGMHSWRTPQGNAWLRDQYSIQKMGSKTTKCHMSISLQVQKRVQKLADSLRQRLGM
jgi:hypothetical protein